MVYMLFQLCGTDGLDAIIFVGMQTKSLLDILLRKSICFPFGQTRYDMNSRCHKVTYLAIRHIECKAHIENSSEFISMHCYAMQLRYIRFRCKPF